MSGTFIEKVKRVQNQVDYFSASQFLHKLCMLPGIAFGKDQTASKEERKNKNNYRQSELHETGLWLHSTCGKAY